MSSTWHTAKRVQNSFFTFKTRDKIAKKFEMRIQKNIILSCTKIKHIAKNGFAVCQKTHGKVYFYRVLYLCRESDRKHTANYRAHGKESDSDSDTSHIFVTLFIINSISIIYITLSS